MEDIIYCCRYCKYGVYIPAKNQVLCKSAGIKPAKDMCKKYTFDPFKFKVKRARNLDFSKFKPEDFNIE